MADDTEVAQQAPDLQGVLSRLYNGPAGNADKILKDLATGIAGSNEIARANNEKGRNFYENYNNGGNLALLGMAGAIGDPTKHGVGAGFEGYANGLIKQREFDFTKQDKLQALQNAQADLARRSATDQFDLGFMKPLEMIQHIGSVQGPMADAALFASSPGVLSNAKGAGSIVGGAAPSVGGGIPQGTMPPIQSAPLPSPTVGGAPQGGESAMPPMSLEAAQKIGADIHANPGKYNNEPGFALAQQVAQVLLRAKIEAAGGNGASQVAVPQTMPSQSAAPQTIDDLQVGNAKRIIAINDADKSKYQGPKGQMIVANAREILDKSNQKAAEKAAAEAAARRPTEVANKADEKHYETQAKIRSEALAAGVNGSNEKQLAQSQMAIMFPNGTDKPPAINSGPWSDTINHYAAVASSLGMKPDFIEAITKSDPNAPDGLKKLQVQMGTSLAREFIGPNSQMRVAEFNKAIENTPGDQMLPKAFKWIIENIIIPKAEHNIKKGHVVKNMDPRDIQHPIDSALYDYETTHPWNKQAIQPGGVNSGDVAIKAAQDRADAAAAELAKRRAASGAQ
jgi:hypothetical protein